MKKRGQLTIFIIIAVVVVLLIILYSAFRSNLFNRPIDGSDFIRDSITNCIELNTKNALYIVSYQGGYNSAPEKSFSFSPTFFPYYYYEGSNLMPSLSEIEDNMGSFVEDYIGGCISDIEDEGFDVSYSEPKVDVEISEEGVNFVVDSTVVLKKNDMSMSLELSRYPQFYESKLHEIYEASESFVLDQMDDPEYYCLSCITSMAHDGGFKFYLFPVVPNVYLVMAFEDDDEPLVFNFVNKYVPE